jgi:hypothetical protein
MPDPTVVLLVIALVATWVAVARKRRPKQPTASEIVRELLGFDLKKGVSIKTYAVGVTKPAVSVCTGKVSSSPFFYGNAICIQVRSGRNANSYPKKIAVKKNDGMWAKNPNLDVELLDKRPGSARK